jgi:hypothetical protein
MGPMRAVSSKRSIQAKASPEVISEALKTLSDGKTAGQTESDKEWFIQLVNVRQSPTMH